MINYIKKSLSGAECRPADVQDNALAYLIGRSFDRKENHLIPWTRITRTRYTKDRSAIVRHELFPITKEHQRLLWDTLLPIDVGRKLVVDVHVDSSSGKDPISWIDDAPAVINNTDKIPTTDPSASWTLTNVRWSNKHSDTLASVVDSDGKIIRDASIDSCLRLIKQQALKIRL